MSIYKKIPFVIATFIVLILTIKAVTAVLGFWEGVIFAAGFGFFLGNVIAKVTEK